MTLSDECEAIWDRLHRAVEAERYLTKIIAHPDWVRDLAAVVEPAPPPSSRWFHVRGVEVIAAAYCPVGSQYKVYSDGSVEEMRVTFTTPAPGDKT